MLHVAHATQLLGTLRIYIIYKIIITLISDSPLLFFSFYFLEVKTTQKGIIIIPTLTNYCDGVNKRIFASNNCFLKILARFQFI